MTVKWRKSFRKDFNKLTQKQKKAWYKAWLLFRGNPRCDKLRRHKLEGKYKELESIDVMPDLRALFFEEREQYIFYFIKNHNQLYS